MRLHIILCMPHCQSPPGKNRILFVLFSVVAPVPRTEPASWLVFEKYAFSEWVNKLKASERKTDRQTLRRACVHTHTLTHYHYHSLSHSLSVSDLFSQRYRTSAKCMLRSINPRDHQGEGRSTWGPSGFEKFVHLGHMQVFKKILNQHPHLMLST